MSIRPIDLNGMIQNTNEVTQVKANEDVKPEMQQMVAQTQFEDQAVENTTRVTEQENIAEDNMNPDEGSGRGYEASARGGKKKKKKEIPGRVMVKKPHGSFNATV